MEHKKIKSSFFPTKNFLVGIDSDGCVFDSMELKQIECFYPAFIKQFKLHSIYTEARKVWEFVNLYSQDRGINRFEALLKSIDLLRSRFGSLTSDVDFPCFDVLREWLSVEKNPGMETLKAEFIRNPHPSLQMTYEWAEQVNRAVAQIQKNVKPFKSARQAVSEIAESADVIVISQSPVDNIELEWKEYDIYRYVEEVGGQEMGSKTDQLGRAAKGRYADEHVLMIGDTPGDHRAAENNDFLFFPIVPGAEEHSWNEFMNEGIERFFSGRYRGEFMEKRIKSFYSKLNHMPDWANLE